MIFAQDVPASGAGLTRLPFDRCPEAVTQVLDVTLEGGARDLEFVEKASDRYRVAAGLEQVDNLVDTFCLAHSVSHYSRHHAAVKARWATSRAPRVSVIPIGGA